MKNHTDVLISHTAICAAGVTNSPYRRAKSDIWLRDSSGIKNACGMGISMYNQIDMLIIHNFIDELAICF